MAGAVVEDTKLGRETIRRSFAWALGEIDKLKPDESYTMTLEKSRGGSIAFRYYPAKKVRE